VRKVCSLDLKGGSIYPVYFIGWGIIHSWETGSQWEQSHRSLFLAWCLVTSAAASTAVSAEEVSAAEAGEKQNPDDGFAAAAVTAEQAAASTAAAGSAASAAASVPIAEEQQQDDPDPAPASIVILCGRTSAGIVATTVSSCQITHFICLHRFIYALLYAGRPVNVSRIQIQIHINKIYDLISQDKIDEEGVWGYNGK